MRLSFNIKCGSILRLRLWPKHNPTSGQCQCQRPSLRSLLHFLTPHDARLYAWLLSRGEAGEFCVQQGEGFGVSYFQEGTQPHQSWQEVVEEDARQEGEGEGEAQKFDETEDAAEDVAEEENAESITEEEMHSLCYYILFFHFTPRPFTELKSHDENLLLVSVLPTALEESKPHVQPSSCFPWDPASSLHSPEYFSSPLDRAESLLELEEDCVQAVAEW